MADGRVFQSWLSFKLSSPADHKCLRRPPNASPDWTLGVRVAGWTVFNVKCLWHVKQIRLSARVGESESCAAFDIWVVSTKVPLKRQTCSVCSKGGIIIRLMKGAEFFPGTVQPWQHLNAGERISILTALLCRRTQHLIELLPSSSSPSSFPSPPLTPKTFRLFGVYWEWSFKGYPLLQKMHKH